MLDTDRLGVPIYPNLIGVSKPSSTVFILSMLRVFGSRLSYTLPCLRAELFLVVAKLPELKKLCSFFVYFRF